MCIQTRILKQLGGIRKLSGWAWSVDRCPREVWQLESLRPLTLDRIVAKRGIYRNLPQQDGDKYKWE